MSWVLVDEKDKAVIAEIERESDRGLIIVGVSLLENRLADLIKMQMGPGMKEVKRNLFKGYGPLATFSAKIDLAFTLQYYPEETRKLLHFLRGIRNDAAHERTSIDFETPTIKDRSKNLYNLVQESHYATIIHNLLFRDAVSKLTNKPNLKPPKEPIRVLNDDGTVTENQFGVGYGDARSTFLAALKLTLYQFQQIAECLSWMPLVLPPLPGPPPSPGKCE